MKVHIIGGPGSGKTTLAGILGARLGIEPIDLDVVAYESAPDGGAITPDERESAAKQIADTEAWITEGIYLGWTNDLLDAADLIVWLDVPSNVAIRRILTRHVKLSLRGTNKHKGLRKLMRFTKWARGYYEGHPEHPLLEHNDMPVTRAATEIILGNIETRQMTIRRDEDISQVLAQLETGRG